MELVSRNPMIVPYFYIPDLDASYAFLVLFSLTSFVILIQSLYYRKLWFIPTAVLGGIVEILGWSGRLWLARNPHVRRNAFEMTVSTSLAAPTVILAANMIVLHFAREGQASAVGPKLYKVLFSISVLLGALAQAVGANLASSDSTNAKLLRVGTRLALAGSAFMLGVALIFAAVLAECVVQSSSKVSPRIRMSLYAIGLGTFFHIIRLIYRVVEYAHGWAGSVMRNEAAFVVLDAVMVLLAMMALIVANHGLFGLGEILKKRARGMEDFRLKIHHKKGSMDSSSSA